MSDKTGYVTFYSLQEGESLEDGILTAISNHLEHNDHIKQTWCSKKDKQEPFYVEDYLITPKSGCSTGKVMVL